jgi:serine/threonine protein kinase
MIGKTISHYTILDKLGEGGMGVVYKALDQKLHRFVAIKFLNPEYVNDSDTIRRFEQEAVSASALNHPNICTVHEIDSHDGECFIVMEYVDGKTLGEVADGKPMPFKQFLDYAIKICRALEAAHAHGIIHRDIKPDNIMIKADGAVKLMDFGLAKLKGDLTPEIKSTAGKGCSTLSSLSMKTTVGKFWGSVAYMSPEQIDKKEIDERSDIFSLGVMLCELYTGQLPFSGLDNLTLMQNILDKDPVISSSSGGIKNSRMDALFLKALAKNPDCRFSSISSLANELEVVQDRASRSRKALLWSGLVVLILIVLFAFSFLKSVEKQRPLYLKMSPVTLAAEINEEWPSFFYDGRHIMFTKRNADGCHLVIKDLTTGRTRELLSGRTTLSPQGSPKGNEIVFSDLRSLVVIDTLGRTVRQINHKGHLPRWSPDGRYIAFCLTSEFHIAADNSILVFDNQEQTISEPLVAESLCYGMPDWSPDGRWIVCVGGIGSVWDLWACDASGKKAHQMTSLNKWITCPRWSHDGQFIYFISNEGSLRDLWRARVDLQKGVLVGAPVQLTNGLHIVSMDISPDDRQILFSQRESQSDLYRIPISAPLSGEPLLHAQLLLTDLGGTENIDISPDGSMLVLETVNKGVVSLQIKHLVTGEQMLLYNTQPAFAPCWSADGKWVAFDAGGGDSADIYQIAAAGGAPIKIIEHPGADWFPTLSPDGRYLCWLSNRAGPMDFWLQEKNSSTPVKMTNIKERKSRAVWSHNSDYIAFFRFDDLLDSTAICILDVKSRRLIELKKVYDQIKNIIHKLSWSEDDTKLYFFAPADPRTFVEMSIRGGLEQTLFKGGRTHFYATAFAVHQDRGYFIVSKDDNDLWLLEGL